MNNYTANAFKFAAIVEFGSFTEAMKIVAMAETHYTTYMPPRPLGPDLYSSNHTYLPRRTKSYLV